MKDQHFLISGSPIWCGQWCYILYWSKEMELLTSSGTSEAKGENHSTKSQWSHVWALFLRISCILHLLEVGDGRECFLMFRTTAKTSFNASSCLELLNFIGPTCHQYQCNEPSNCWCWCYGPFQDKEVFSMSLLFRTSCQLSSTSLIRNFSGWSGYL